LIFLFGAKYAASGAAFAVLAFSIGLHFATKPSVNLLAVKDPPKLTFLYFGLFLLNITANFILIPRWGLMGAATVSAFCEVPALIGCLWFTRSYFDFPKYGFYRGVAASFLASAVMGVGLYWDPRLYWLALGPLVYGSLLYLLGGIDRDDMVSLRSILKKTG
jgi:O-antigen/teichoic acid export membrane protein